MKNIQTILFDLDGTISDPKEGITKSIAFALGKMGCASPPLEELSVFIGPPLRQTFNLLMRDPLPEAVENAIKFYRQRYSDEGYGMIENKLYPTIQQTLETLKEQGKRLLIATSKPTDIAEKILNHFGLSNLFIHIYGAEHDGTHSDKADLIGHILSCENIAAENAVMIGDRKYDIIGAIKNGVPSIGVLWGYGSADELNEAGAHHLCHAPLDLLNEVWT